MTGPRLKSITEQEEKTGFRDSFKALKTVPRFFKEIYKSSPGLFIVNTLSRLINAFTPIVILWVGKMIIDEILLQISLEEPNLRLLWIYVLIELGVAILSDLLARLINLTDGLLGDLYSNHSSEKIIRKTSELTISQLEDPDFYDKLDRARSQTRSRVELMSNVLSQAQTIISVVSLIAGLVYFEPLLILILILSVIPSFINEAKFSNTRYSVARSWTAERRELDYLRFIGANNQTAKEIKLFGLTDFIANRFKIRNVHFTYPGSDTEILKGISFKLRAGEKMAFVGQNGAGKTTLIKLFLRFYDPTEGEILLDGINIKEFDIDAYRNRFGVIFQDFFRYEFTLRENIAVGNIEEVQNDHKIHYAASKSLAEQVIAEMEDGLEQRLGRRFSKGQELSGGQWQKIALARAYMKDADIMILDEPTSALDAQAEYDVFERFIGLTKGKTSIIISHRFSTVRMADRILVLKDGKVLEIGTHEELMENPKLYSELFKLQAAGYQ